MACSLILLDSQPDALWRCYFKACMQGVSSGDHVEVINLHAGAASVDGMRPVARRPHCFNALGWRRWLRNRHIDRIDCYHITDKTLAVLAAARLAVVDSTVVMTGRYDAAAGRRIKFLTPLVDCYRCWADFIAADLRRMSIAPHKIEVAAPMAPLAGVQDSDYSLPERITGGPILLSLDAPGNTAAMHRTIKAAAIVKYMAGQLRLIVAGPCTDAQHRNLLKYERIYDVPGMLHIDNDQSDWRTLCRGVDAVSAPSERLVEIMRLLQARELNVPIVASPGDSEEFLTDYDHARIAGSTEVRALTTAIVNTLGPTVGTTTDGKD